jgi:hypothetical protein
MIASLRSKEAHLQLVSVFARFRTSNGSAPQAAPTLEMAEA